MSHEHDHEHDHHAAPRQPSRPGPARGRAGTGQPALSPQEEQLEHALLLHQAHHLLREAHQRAAARAGASTDAAHAAHDGHTAAADAAQLGHTALMGDQAQDRDYFSQVQADLTAGNVVGALGLLDTYWPASARDRAEARAYVGGLIVARLHATLAPLTMDRMLHTLEPVRPRLDEVLTGGHRVRDLLLAAAHGLDRDRLAYALDIVERGIGFTQTGSQPHYLVDHYDDYTDAVRYFQGQKMPVDSAQHLPVGSEQVYLHTVLPQALETFSRRAKDGVDEAIDSFGDDPVDYTAWFATMAGTVLGAAACLTGGGAVAVIGFAAAGAAVAALGSVPTAQPTLKDLVKRNIGDKDSRGQNNNCSVINGRNGKFVSDQYANAQKDKWDDNRLSLEILKQAFAPALIMIDGDGLPSLDGDAVQAFVKRDVLL